MGNATASGFVGGDSSPKLLVIDDLADRIHQADLLLDQNFFGEATHQRYQYLAPPDCRYLLGPFYALLAPEYALLHPLVPPRNELRRLLVFFGGVDPLNLTGLVLEALNDPDLADLSVDVVLGLQSSNRQSVAELVARRPNTTLYGPMPSLAGLIARADFAIGAGGSTTWERACLRLPSMVVTIAANQLPFSEALDEAGYVQLLGDGHSVTADQVRSAVLRLLTEPKSGKVCPALTDGCGASRLAMAMLGPQGAISLRSAKAADEALLLHWANDPQVRINSFSPDPIPPEIHHYWFHKGLEDPNRLLLISSTPDGCPIGQIRFDRQPASPQADVTEASVDISLDPCARGHRLAAELVRLGLQVLEQHWGSSVNVVAEVLSSNTSSNSCFASAGFKLDPESFFGAFPPVSYGQSMVLASISIVVLSICCSCFHAFLLELLIALWV